MIDSHMHLGLNRGLNFADYDSALNLSLKLDIAEFKPELEPALANLPPQFRGILNCHSYVQCCFIELYEAWQDHFLQALNQDLEFIAQCLGDSLLYYVQTVSLSHAKYIICLMLLLPVEKRKHFKIFVGLHPYYFCPQDELNFHEVKLLVKLIEVIYDHNKELLGGIGEIGLDLHPRWREQIEIQQEVVEFFMDYRLQFLQKKHLFLPFSFHVHKAHNELIRLMHKEQIKLIRLIKVDLDFEGAFVTSASFSNLGVVHGFNNSKQIASKYLDFWYGLGVGVNYIQHKLFTKLQQLQNLEAAFWQDVTSSISKQTAQSYLIKIQGSDYLAPQCLFVESDYDGFHSPYSQEDIVELYKLLQTKIM